MRLTFKGTKDDVTHTKIQTCQNALTDPFK